MAAASPEQLEVQMQAAYSAKDADAVASLYEDDALYAMSIAGLVVEGRDAVREAVKAMFDSMEEISLEFDPPRKFEVAGDWAFVHGTSRATIVFGDGSRQQMQTRATTVAHRGSDGLWRYALDHASV